MYFLALASDILPLSLFNLLARVHMGLGFTLTLVWVSNAIPRPPAKRSAALGLVNGFGNLGNLYIAMPSSPHACADFSHRMGSYTWPSNWGPEYHQSMIIGLCALAFATALGFGACWVSMRDASQYD